MKTKIISLNLALLALVAVPLAQAQIIYSNTFSVIDPSPVANPNTSLSGITPQSASQTIQANGNTATLVNTTTGGGYMASAGIIGMPSVANTNTFTMSCDFILGTGMATSTSSRFGYGFFSSTTSPSWLTPNAGRVYVQPNSSGQVGIFIQNFLNSSTFDSIPAYTATTLSESDTYRLTSVFSFTGTPGVAGSSGVNKWDVTLTLYDVTTSTTIATVTTVGNPAWFANTSSFQNLASGSAQVAFWTRGTPASGITVDNFSVVQALVGTTPTTTSLASSQNPTSNGNPVTFTVTVSPSAATGTVRLEDGATTIGSAALAAGQAAFTNVLSVGTHYLKAVYNGNPTYSNSVSPVLAQAVVVTGPTVLSYDGFEDYTNGTDITWPKMNGGYGWSSPWFVSGSTAAKYASASALAFPAGVSYLPGTNELYFANEINFFDTVGRNLATNVTVTSGMIATRYMSFLLRTDTLGTYDQIGFGNRGNAGAFITFGVNADFCIEFGSSFNDNTNSIEFLAWGLPMPATTYFVVARITSDTNGTYQADARFYGPSDTVDSSDTNGGFAWDITSTNIPAKGFNLDRVWGYHGNSVMELDEVRVGTAWAAVAAATVTIPPTLTISKSGSNVLIDWPATYTGYILKSSGDLTTPIGSWTSLGSGSVVGPNNEVSVSASTGMTFFRLVK